MDFVKLADLLLPDVDGTPEEYEAMFPPRDLPEKAQVTRLAPSPTGFIHLGNLFGALADERIAHQSGGVFYLRIEDTDAKREVPGAVDIIIHVLRYFGIEFDEGAGFPETEQKYGPYFQRQRAKIYQAYAKDLIKRGLAYPCFCTEEELAAVKERQTAEQVLTGYYGRYASCRNLTYEQVEENIKAGKPFVIRLRSMGQEGNEITFRDTIKGEIKFPENIQDLIILKSDGIPTYHFAHVIDDHLMRTSLVIRGEEWLSSVPLHYELTKVLGFRFPSYAHTAHLMKMEETVDEDGAVHTIKRKLSKRKDPELSLDYYRQDGYHPQGVKVYLMTLLNSNFEQWYDKNPTAPITDFKFNVKKMGQSGALFDMDKLSNICKAEFSKLEPDEVYAFLKEWVDSCHGDQSEIYFKDEEKMKKIISLIMGAGGKRRRKDFGTAKEFFALVPYFFKETFSPAYSFKYDADTVKAVLETYKETYSHTADNGAWFETVKGIADKLGFASDMKAYKADPSAFKGNVSDVAEVIRIATTGLSNTPDLWSINQIIGEADVRERIDAAIASL